MKPIEDLSFADIVSMKKYIEDNFVMKGRTEVLYKELDTELKKRIMYYKLPPNLR